MLSGPGWSYDFVEGKIDYGDSVALNTLIGGGWDLTITGPCPDASYEVGWGIGKHLGVGLTFGKSSLIPTGAAFHLGLSLPIVEFPVYVNVPPEF